MFDDFDTQITCEEFYNEKYCNFDSDADSLYDAGFGTDESYVIENDYLDDIPF